MNIELYIPKVDDYWYEEHIQSDPNSMSYNAGYNVSYYGYHYDTGCIDFPKEKWQETYNRRINENKYFAYIKNKKIKVIIVKDLSRFGRNYIETGNYLEVILPAMGVSVISIT